MKACPILNPSRRPGRFDALTGCASITCSLQQGLLSSGLGPLQRGLRRCTDPYKHCTASSAHELSTNPHSQLRSSLVGHNPGLSPCQGFLSTNALRVVQRALSPMTCAAWTPQCLLARGHRHTSSPFPVSSKETAGLVFCDPDPTQA